MTTITPTQVQAAQAFTREHGLPVACPTCGHSLSSHDPEDATCDHPISNTPDDFGGCKCGRVNYHAPLNLPADRTAALARVRDSDA